MRSRQTSKQASKQSPEKLLDNKLGNTHRGGEAGALDAQKVDEAVETHVGLAANDKVLKGGAIGARQLGPDAAIAAGKVLPTHVRKVHLDGGDGSVEVVLIDAVVGAAGDPLEVWAKADLATEVEREVGPEGGDARRRTRVDEAADVCVGSAVAEVVPLGVERLHVALRWENHVGDSWRMEAGTVDHASALDREVFGIGVGVVGVQASITAFGPDLVHVLSWKSLDGDDLSAERQTPIALLELRVQVVHEAVSGGDACSGRVEYPEAGLHKGLLGLGLRQRHKLGRHANLLRLGVQLLEVRLLVLILCNDPLATLLHRDVCSALVDLLLPPDAEFCLERVWRVVEPGVHDLRVPAARLLAVLPVLLEDQHPVATVVLDKLGADRQAHYAAANDRVGEVRCPCYASGTEASFKHQHLVLRSGAAQKALPARKAGCVSMCK